MTKLNVDYSQTQLFTYERHKFWVQVRTEYPSFIIYENNVYMYPCKPVLLYEIWCFGVKFIRTCWRDVKARHDCVYRIINKGTIYVLT